MTTVNVATTFMTSLLLGILLLQYRKTDGGMSMKEEYREEYRKFGLNVVYYRKKLRLTQLQLAELLDIQRSHISAIELGNVGVSFDLLFKMCEVFNIKPKDLFDFRD